MAELTSTAKAAGLKGFEKTKECHIEPQPFDAEKLWAFFHDEEHWDGVLRSKGFFWVAADHRVAYEWAQAGGVCSMNPAGMWWASIPKEHWGHPEGQMPDEQPEWDPRFGDRALSMGCTATALFA